MTFTDATGSPGCGTPAVTTVRETVPWHRKVRTLRGIDLLTFSDTGEASAPDRLYRTLCRIPGVCDFDGSTLNGVALVIRLFATAALLVSGTAARDARPRRHRPGERARAAHGFRRPSLG